MTGIVLTTGAVMPRPDGETHLVVQALRARGVDAVVLAWDAPVDWGGFDLVVVRTTWDYHRRLEEFLGWVSHVGSVTRILNPVEIVRWNSHKRYLLELSDRGVAVVPTVLLTGGQDPSTLGSAFPDAPELVVKPAVSVGAIGAQRGRADQLIEHVAQLLREGDVLVQPFVASVESDGETSLLYFGGHFSHAVRKSPRHGDYRVQEQHGGSVQHHEPDRDELAVAEAALRAAPAPVPYARVDLVRGPDGPMLMELELIEPALFLDETSANRFADVLLNEAQGP